MSLRRDLTALAVQIRPGLDETEAHRLRRLLEQKAIEAGQTERLADELVAEAMEEAQMQNAPPMPARLAHLSDWVRGVR